MLLETERLYLRTIDENDIEDIYEYSKEKNVGPNAGWKPHENLEETINIAKQIFINQEGVFGIVTKENNKMIGSIGIINDPKRENDKSRMLGYAISEKYWKKGIMTEAVQKVIEYGFVDLKLDLISAYCYPFNMRSKRILEKNNFQYEGKLKQAEKIFDGNIYDNECYILINNHN